MSEELTPLNLPLFSSEMHYLHYDFPFTCHTFDKAIHCATGLNNSEEIALIFFHDDNGLIKVNSKDYFTKKGMMMILGSYHYRKFLPIKGDMHITVCNISYSMFIYMVASPYYDLNALTLSSDPLRIFLTNDYLKYGLRIMNQLKEYEKSDDQKFLSNKFFLSMKLFGLFQLLLENHDDIDSINP